MIEPHVAPEDPLRDPRPDVEPEPDAPLPGEPGADPAAGIGPSSPVPGVTLPDATLPEGPVPEAPPPQPSLVQRLVGFFEARGLGPAVLVGLGIGAGGVAVLCLLVGHSGLAGVFGLIGVALSALGLAPRPNRDPAIDPLARGVALLLDLGLLGGIVARAAAVGEGLTLVLGLVVMILSAWLPHLKEVAPAGLIPPHAGFWRRSERLAIVMLGAFTGRLVFALALVAIVGALDAVFRLDRLRTGTGRRWHPRFLEPLVAEDGTLQPVVRYGSLLLAILLLAVLPQQAGWRF